jgi:ribose transport system substrate-binding protein
VSERSRSWLRRRAGLLLVVTSVLAVLAASVGAAAGSATPSLRSHAQSCGGVPYIAPNDASGALAGIKLTKALTHDYTGWPDPISKSAWSNWKPKGKPPYKVALVWNSPSNPFNLYSLNLIQKFLKRSPLIDKNIIVTTTSSQTAVAEQVQDYNAAVQQGANIIVVDALSAPALLPAVQAAAAAGIPTISQINDFDSPDVLSISPNPYLDAAYSADAMVKALGGQGNVLQVLGVPGTSTVVNEQNAWNKIFASCPGINVVGTVTGLYSVSVAQSGVLQFLSTHPQPVNGVIETAVMSQGILNAFLQSGRTVPFITDITAQKGFVAYWAEHVAGGYHAFGVLGSAESASDICTKVILRMLAGQGPKINQLIWRHPQITDKTVGSIASKSWTDTTIGTVGSPVSTRWTDSDLDRFFNHPNITKGIHY